MDRESVGFVMYKDYMEYFRFLSKEEKADLLDAVFAYAFLGEEMEGLSKISQLVFTIIKNRIGRDLDKYEKRCEKNRQNGTLGGRPTSSRPYMPDDDRKGTEGKEDKVKIVPPAADAKMKQEEGEKKEADSVTEKRFEEFFASYPKKSDREDAMSVFASIGPDEETFKRIMYTLRKKMNSNEWIKKSGQFVPKAGVWLSRREWETGEDFSVMPPSSSFDTNDFFNAALESALLTRPTGEIADSG